MMPRLFEIASVMVRFDHTSMSLVDKPEMLSSAKQLWRTVGDLVRLVQSAAVLSLARHLPLVASPSRAGRLAQGPKPDPTRRARARLCRSLISSRRHAESTRVFRLEEFQATDNPIACR